MSNLTSEEKRLKILLEAIEKATASELAILYLWALGEALFELVEDRYHPTDARIMRALEALRKLDEVLMKMKMK